jgi:glycosyltransferase involved in cell wall biosynthesis
VLAESLIFVFLSVTEGLGRMPLEAMSCGCLVAAWRSGPLKETLPRCVQFEFGCVLEMVRFIERVMDAFPDRLDEWRAVAAAGRDVAASYSVERQEQSVLAAWTDILNTGEA